MFLFRPSYLKEGPGLTPEQTKDRGLKRFFRIYLREFWPLMGLNLLFVALCIPMFTAFPAWRGLCAVMRELVDGENVYYLSTFKKAFLENLPRTFLGGVILTASGCICLVGVWFYLSTIGGAGGVVLAGLTLSIALFVALTAWCFYPLSLVNTDSCVRELLRSALLYAGAGIKYTLPALLLSAALLIAIVLLSPWALLFALVWVFSFIAYLNAYTMRMISAMLERHNA